MLRIIDRYLLRELSFGFVASAVVLLVVTLGGTVADILDKVARGRLPADLMLELIGLRSVDALTVLLPVAAFLGVMLAYGRLWRDSEMAVFQASGLSVLGLVRPLALMALPLAVAVALIAFWLAPAAVRYSQNLVDEANRSMVVAGLEPGLFKELPGKGGEIFVGGMSADGTRFTQMFVESERSDGEDTRIDVITAEHGELFRDTDGVSRFLSLRDGFRVEGRLGHDDFRLLRFQRNDISLPDSESDASADAVKRAAPTGALLASADPVQRAEFHWRLAAPLSVLVLAALALPLARVTPREARYGKLLIGVLCYIVYANLLNIGRTSLAQGKLPMGAGLWLVHLPTALVALWLIWRSQRLPRPRGA
jgi:lipopolysaccharide export system permease protein